jgi:hypothetical protein
VSCSSEQVNHLEWHKEISTVVKDWRDGDYFDFGYKFGFALGLGSHKTGAQVVHELSFENVSVSKIS